MRKVDIRAIDLNLLVMLDALLEERNVTRAAHRLGMSQPAASRALGRLRALFADALLVDGTGGYLLSARAEDIRPMLRRTLAGIGQMLQANPFDPATATGYARLLMPDLQAAILMPHLLTRFADEAPALNLDVQALGSSVMDALNNDVADAAVGLFDEAPPGIHRRRLYEERLVTIMRSEHPAAHKKLTLDRFLALDHIVVSITGVGQAPIDEALALMERKRRVKVRAPNFFAAMEIAARSDLVMTLPASLAHVSATAGRFVSLTPPLSLKKFPMSLVWHARHQDTPRHKWLRRAIVAAAREISGKVEI
ncbi:LysR family transcriptional regulator [Hyphomicrobium sp.]|uniref:LysR family transcriptional regulator n=1 Tax=Hyphomicrobium sp. TaxID=82 RepID=UPI0025C650B8|nr:LysR family transcriptional regulator [Hyphomicrobium sp.]MCC7252488.1 LysR family transcriptional regulator [Hyphomicrobium sp.]